MISPEPIFFVVDPPRGRPFGGGGVCHDRKYYGTSFFIRLEYLISIIIVRTLHYVLFYINCLGRRVLKVYYIFTS